MKKNKSIKEQINKLGHDLGLQTLEIYNRIIYFLDIICRFISLLIFIGIIFFRLIPKQNSILWFIFLLDMLLSYGQYFYWLINSNLTLIKKLIKDFNKFLQPLIKNRKA